MTRIEEITNRFNARTTGQWFTENCNVSIDGKDAYVLKTNDHPGQVAVLNLIDYRDADFIAHAPDDIAYLLARINELEARLQDSERIANLMGGMLSGNAG